MTKFAKAKGEIAGETTLSEGWTRLSTYELDYTDSSGVTHRLHREVYHRTPAATILLYDPKRATVVLVKQFRLAPHLHGEPAFMIETPAGLLDGEEPEAAIRREAVEETGFQIRDVHFLFKAYSSPGSNTEVVHFFAARIDTADRVSHGGGLDHEHEDIEVLEIPLDRELDKKLAAAGVTTAYAAISFSTESVYGHVRSLETTSAVIEGINRLKDNLLVDHRVHARYEITNLGAAPALEKLLEAGQIDMVSLTDHTPGQGQYNNIQSYILSIAERRAISEETAAEMVAKRIALRNNPEIEAKLKEIVALSLKQKLSLASHDDDSIEKVAEMHDLGVTISEFPVSLPAAEEARRRGLWTLMGAPNALRGQSISGNMSALDAAKAGVLTVIAADYHPAAFVPGIFKIAEYTAMPVAVAMATRNAARSAGLTDRGEIAIGQRADLVVVEPGNVHRIRATFRGGRFVYSDGTLHQLQALAA